MGNSSSKDNPPARHGGGDGQPTSSQATAVRPPPGPVPPPPSSERGSVTTQVYSGRSGRGSRADLSFLNLGRDREAAPAPERPRETKQEREARKTEKERQVRLKEREKSMKNEGVDGGYLVTLGTYTGVEDFSKSVVRQLQIERRLAPFWKGLNDHSDSWTEAQLVAAARGLPIPAADEVPPPMARTASQASSNPAASDINVNNLTVPIASRSQSYESSTSAHLSASHPAFSSSHSGPASPTTPSQSTAQLFRGRAKTLASLATGSKSSSPDLTPTEIRLAKDPNVNGQPIEAYLYKDASECPICFMYYPPYLNKTRCCDQPICSECFVQIKRPDPHPPEHEQPGQQRPPEEEADQLVSEVAACPFCVTPEFGVSYAPPPFRRGLAYAAQRNALSNPTSAMSSSTSLANGGNRRRATSLSASSSQVITTDRVRPDWARKLADARAHALRRSAAATALHNAAYVLGNQTDVSARGGLGGFSRRRRTLLFESPGGSGAGTPGEGAGIGMSPYGHVLRRRALEAGGGGEGGDEPGSRRTRVDDLEDLMMMEAIRLSLAAEEDRMRKTEKDARKDAKKRAKDEKKEAKHAEKLARKGGGGSSSQLYKSGSNDSSSNWASTSMARSTSNIGLQQSIPEEHIQGKGKAPAQPSRDFGFNPLSDPSSTLNTEMREEHDDSLELNSSSAASGAQRHLEESRANLQPSTSTPIPIPSPSRQRGISNASSVASSIGDESLPSVPHSNLHSASGSGLDLATPSQETPPPSTTPTPGLEPMLNFRSLAAVIGEEQKPGHESEHIEHAAATDNTPMSRAEEELKEPEPTGSPQLSPNEGNRSRGDSGESSASAPPPIYVEHPPSANSEDGEEITPAPRLIHRDVDTKDVNRVDVVDHAHAREATQ